MKSICRFAVAASTSRSFTSSADCYAILDVEPAATSVDIKRAFYRQARKHHPDAGGGNIAAQQFVQCVLAYETLMDPYARTLHDADRTHPSTHRGEETHRAVYARQKWGRRRGAPRRPTAAWSAESGEEKTSHALDVVNERLFLSVDRAMLHAFEGPDELATIAALNAASPEEAAAQLGDAPPAAYPWAFELDEIDLPNDLNDDDSSARHEILTMVVGRSTLGCAVVTARGEVEVEYGGAVVARAARSEGSIKVCFIDSARRDGGDDAAASVSLSDVAPSPNFSRDALASHRLSSGDTTLLTHRTPARPPSFRGPSRLSPLAYLTHN